MTSESTKRKIIDAVEQLPEGASIEDAMERLQFLGKVERGLTQADWRDHPARRCQGSAHAVTRIVWAR